jgi:8-oxo-dGTP pyrophosphatase MutT (NUDIX family)
MNVAADFGFYFHHSSEDGHYVCMILWTDKTCANRMPQHAHHYVGVGGILLNHDATAILLVQEHRRSDDRLWKLPGGFVDKGEGIKKAVVRECKEETG